MRERSSVEKRLSKCRRDARKNIPLRSVFSSDLLNEIMRLFSDQLSDAMYISPLQTYLVSYFNRCRFMTRKKVGLPAKGGLIPRRNDVLGNLQY